MPIPIGGDQGTATQRAASGERGYGTVRDYRGEEVVAAWCYLPSFRWGMNVKQDAKEAFALVNFQRAAIIGLLAGVTVPAIRGMVQGTTLSRGHRQLTDALNRARQEALRLRTTVYMVFAPTNVWQTRMALDAQIESMIVERQLAPQRFREQALRSFTNIALGVFHSYALLVERELPVVPGAGEDALADAALAQRVALVGAGLAAYVLGR
jgi:hypothetical protein